MPGWLQGSYVFKLLAVDVPTASSAEQRLYVEGDSKLYHRGGVINELRDPFLQVRHRRHSDAPQWTAPNLHGTVVPHRIPGSHGLHIVTMSGSANPSPVLGCCRHRGLRVGLLPSSWQAIYELAMT